MHLASGKFVIRKGRVRTYEDIVLYPQAVPQLHATLHRDAISQDNVILDKDPITDVAVLANARLGQYVSKRPDSGSLSNMLRFAYTLRMQIKTHGLTFLESIELLSCNIGIYKGRFFVFSNARHI